MLGKSNALLLLLYSVFCNVTDGQVPWPIAQSGLLPPTPNFISPQQYRMHPPIGPPPSYPGQTITSTLNKHNEHT